VNLALDHQDLVKEMAVKWQAWAVRCGVVPKPPKVMNRPEWAKGHEE